MVVLIFLMLGFGAVLFSVVGSFVVPLVDLLRRENAVRWWVGLPLVGPLLPLATTLFTFTEDGLNGRVFDDLGLVLVLFHLALAGLLAWSGLSLAVVRGLRPGGPTRRRFRTSVVAVVLLVLIGVQPVLWTVYDEALFYFLGWMGLGSFLGVCWVVFLNREGPYRLTEGKRWSAALLLASLFQFGLATAVLFEMVGFLDPADWGDVPSALFLGVVPVAVVLSLGLRLLAGPLPAAPFVLSLGVTPTVVLVPLSVAAWHPVRAGHELPAWVDLLGEPGPPRPLESSIDCVQYPGEAPFDCRVGWGQTFFAPLRSTPLTEFTRDDVLVDAGRTTLHNRWASGTPYELHEVDGLARIGTIPTLYPLGPELHVALRRLGRERVPLMVERSPRWTAQDFVSICASYPWTCTLSP